MRKTILIFICHLSLSSLFAQKINFGFHLSGNSYHQNLINDNLTPESGFEATKSYGIGIGAIIQYKATDRFAIRLVPNITSIKTSFVSTLPDIKRSRQDALQFDYYAVNLPLSGKFRITYKFLDFSPEIGLNFGINKYINTTYIDRASAPGQSALIYEDLQDGVNYASEKFRFSPGLILGLNIAPKNSRIEISTRFIYNPLDFEPEDVVVPFNDRENPNSIQSKVNVFSLAFHYYIWEQ